MLQSKRRIKKPNNPVTAIAVGLICCGLWLGAGVTAAADPGPLRSSGPAPAIAATAKAKTAKTPEQAKAVKAPLAHFRYSPTGKADPFRPFLERDEIARKKAVKPKPVPLSPLQRAGIEQFRLVGIAGSASRRIAVVEDAAGKFYTVKAGTVIGQNGGRVAEIHEDRVIIEQKLSDQKKQTKVNRVVIKLRKEDYEGRL
jgi:type IV pilus assembly protein PilP